MDLEIHNVHSPIKHLSSQIGLLVEILISSGYQEHINDIDNNRIDITYLRTHKLLPFKKILISIRAGGNNANLT